MRKSLRKMAQNIRIFYHLALKFCPALALIFSILVTINTLYINQDYSLLFIFFSIQVYLNWYSIYTSSYNATTMRDTFKSTKIKTVTITMNNDSPYDEAPRSKYWYCDKCCFYTYKPTQHCSACKKCFHFRDHHCFFIGGCILKENMGNFILICFHTSFACLYSLTVVGPYLYDSLSEIIEINNSNLMDIFLNFCFPVALARFFITGEGRCLFLVTFFDILFSVFFMSFIYGAWKLFYSLSGRQRYYPHISGEYSIREIFGSYGIWNFLFPYNGLRRSEDIHGKYMLKEV